MALTRKMADGAYLKYFPFAILTEASQERRYHNKLLEDAKLLTNLNKGLDATIELLGSVAS